MLKWQENDFVCVSQRLLVGSGHWSPEDAGYLKFGESYRNAPVPHCFPEFPRVSYPPNSYKLCYISKRNKDYLSFIIRREINNYLFKHLKFQHRHFLFSLFLSKEFLICLLFSSVKRLSKRILLLFLSQGRTWRLHRFPENCHKGRIDSPVSSARLKSIILFLKEAKGLHKCREWRSRLNHSAISVLLFKLSFRLLFALVIQ